MARTVREARLETRSARLKLIQRPEPYWRAIHEGAHLGYYRGSRGGKWVARFRQSGANTKGYQKETLGEADDFNEADGERFLDFKQAQDSARAWFAAMARHGARDLRSLTVADVLDEYMDAFRGKSVVATRSRINAILKPDLGGLKVSELTKKIIADWHEKRATSPARLRTGRRAKSPNLRPIEGEDGVRRRRSTANRDLTVLKAALNRAASLKEGLPVEAWRNVKPFSKVDGAKLRYLSDEEARRLVNATNSAFRPMVQASLLTGARYGELRAARAADFDASAGVLWLKDTKAGVPRVVYLESEGTQLLLRACAGKRPTDLIFQAAALRPRSLLGRADRLVRRLGHDRSPFLERGRARLGNLHH